MGEKLGQSQQYVIEPSLDGVVELPELPEEQVLDLYRDLVDKIQTTPKPILPPQSKSDIKQMLSNLMLSNAE